MTDRYVPTVIKPYCEDPGCPCHRVISDDGLRALAVLAAGDDDR